MSLDLALSSFERSLSDLNPSLRDRHIVAAFEPTLQGTCMCYGYRDVVSPS